MLVQNMQNSQMFEKIHNEFVEFHIQYEIAKKSLEENYIIPNYKKTSSWNLNYKTRRVTVNE